MKQLSPISLPGTQKNSTFLSFENAPELYLKLKYPSKPLKPRPPTFRNNSQTNEGCKPGGREADFKRESEFEKRYATPRMKEFELVNNNKELLASA